MAEAGVTPELLVSVMRVVGGLMAGLALLYVVFAVLAFRGRNWARILVTVMTVGFTLLLLSGLITAPPAPPATPASWACCSGSSCSAWEARYCCTCRPRRGS